MSISKNHVRPVAASRARVCTYIHVRTWKITMFLISRTFRRKIITFITVIRSTIVLAHLVRLQDIKSFYTVSIIKINEESRVNVMQMYANLKQSNARFGSSKRIQIISIGRKIYHISCKNV